MTLDQDLLIALASLMSPPLSDRYGEGQLVSLCLDAAFDLLDKALQPKPDHRGRVRTVRVSPPLDRAAPENRERACELVRRHIEALEVTDLGEALLAARGLAVGMVAKDIEALWMAS
jgi:hypothetical protein